MIRGIGNNTRICPSNSKLTKIKQPKSKINDLTNEENVTKLVQPSLDHLKANFISFAGRAETPSNLPAQNNDNENNNEYLLEKLYPAIDKISDRRPDELVPANFCKKSATQAAILLKSGKLVNVNYKRGTMPNLLTDTFTAMVKQDKFKGIGFAKDNTDVFVIDADQSATKGQIPLNLVMPILQSKIFGREQIVFVKNFEETLGKVGNVGSFLRTRDINLIGLSENDGELKISDPSWDRTAKNINLVAPSIKETKELMLSENFMYDSIPEYRNHRNDITYEAADKAVDLTSNQAGEFPKKAVDLVRIAVNQKRKDNPAKDQIVVTAEDVEMVFKKNPEFKTSVKSAGGQFEVIQDSKVRLKDVGGIKGIKKEIQEDIIGYIKNPKKFSDVGVKPPKGVLLSGPPGTGKTLLAKAIAGESEVPFIAASGSEFIEKFVGVGAQRVRELFSLAKQEARKSDKKTAIIFIDEIDAVGGKRGGDGGGNSEKDQTINQLLTELNGLKDSDDVNIITIAATNRPEMLDDALTRAGRFDLKVTVPNPANSEESRLEILQIHAKKKPFKDEKSKQLILQEMAESTSGCSGADLAEIINKAARLTVKPNRKSPFITINDMQEAKLQLKFGTISEIDEVKWSKENTVAHEAGHAICNLVFNQAMSEDWKKPYADIDTITLQPRGNFLGAVTYKPSKQNPEVNLYSVMSRITSSYGGLQAERARKGFNGSGVSMDLQNITTMAKDAVTKWGLGPNTGAISIAENPTVETMFSKEIKDDIRIFTKTGYKISKKIIELNKDFVQHYVDVYNENEGKGGENLSGKEFTKMYKDWAVENDKEKDLVHLNKEIRDEVKRIQNLLRDTTK